MVRFQPSPRPGKATRAASCKVLEQIPNIGVSLAADLRSIGIAEPRDLVGRDPLALYTALCERSGRRQDPCVLDTFMAATDFMGGAAPAPWWRYTARRRPLYGQLGASSASGETGASDASTAPRRAGRSLRGNPMSGARAP